MQSHYEFEGHSDNKWMFPKVVYDFVRYPRV
jgi:hypothetical protein